MKKLLLLLFVTATFVLKAQQTYVPDDNFEQELINLGYDSGALDNYVPTNNILYLGSLDLNSRGIYDLTGIEDFIGLYYLDVGGNHLTEIDIRNSTALQVFYCGSNQLTTLNLSHNVVLNTFNAGGNQLTYLDLRNGNNANMAYISTVNNPNLTCIQVDDVAYSTANWTSIEPQSYFSEDCNGTFVPDDNFEQALINLGYDTILDDYVITSNINSITSLNISNKNIADLTGIEDFIALETLVCSNNQLTSIDISQNVALTYLDCNFNQLSSLDVTNNTALTLLACRANQLTSINVFNNDLLEYFSCRDNLLIDLDVSNNSNLVRLWCFNNQLTSLNVKNGANTNITNSNFDATNNPNLNCIQIDDLAWSTSNWTNIDAASSFSEDCDATYVPDDNFEQALIDLGYDTVLDNYVATSNINTITWLNVSNKNIADLTGIEGFTMLEYLSCSNNLLTSINVIANLHLTDLLCNNNQLTSLNVSNNSNLSFLRCEYNLLTSLNVSQNTALGYLKCQDNQITSLDLSLNSGLFVLWCQNNQLSNLNIRNGNNYTMLSTDFKANGNPNLYCIDVDDVAYSTSNWYGGIDSQTSFSEYCNSAYVPDDNFEQALIDLGYDTILDDYVLKTNINTVTNLDVSYENITDLTGIEGFALLTSLQCNNNQLTSLDVSQNSLLTDLVCSNNNTLGSLDISQNTVLANLNCQNIGITTIDLSQNTVLTNLNIKNNQLTSLDISQNNILSVLDCRNNQLTSLDISNNTSLTSINCSSNQLTNFDITNNPSITLLNISNNLMESLDMANGNNTIITAFFATGNAGLTCINVDDVAWSDANWSNIDAQSYFSTVCNVTYVPDDNFEQALIDLGYDSGTLDDYVPTVNIESITGLDISDKSIADLTGISDFVALTFLNVRNNSLGSIDITQNTALTYLDCFNNQLTGIDVTQNISLIHLMLSDNQLTGIDITQNTALTNLILFNNQLTSIDVTQNTSLTQLDLSDNQLSSINVDLNIALTILRFNNNQLTNINISQNTDLIVFSGKNNVLTSLDLSMNTALTTVRCEDNQLTSLNLKNGNNTAMVSGNFRATNNPNLTCIEVDDAAWSSTNWATSIDSTASFSESCNYLAVADFDLDTAFTIYPNPAKTILNIETIATIQNISIYNLMGKLVLKNTTKIIDISELPIGIYLIRVEDIQGATNTQKFIKN